MAPLSSVVFSSSSGRSIGSFYQRKFFCIQGISINIAIDDSCRHALLWKLSLDKERRRHF